MIQRNVVRVLIRITASSNQKMETFVIRNPTFIIRAFELLKSKNMKSAGGD